MCASERMGTALLLLGEAAGSRAGMRLAAVPGAVALAELPDDLSPFGLAVLDRAGVADRHVLRRLLAARLNFCLTEPPMLVGGGRLRLREAARKRRLHPVWLSSWRFRAAAAKAREVAVSGCLGEFGVVAGPVGAAYDAELWQDLGEWLGGGASPAQVLAGVPGVMELRGALGVLRLELGERQDCLRLELAGGIRRELLYPAESVVAETGLLVYLLRQGGLPGIFPEL